MRSLFAEGREGGQIGAEMGRGWRGWSALKEMSTTEMTALQRWSGPDPPKSFRLEGFWCSRFLCQDFFHRDLPGADFLGCPLILGKLAPKQNIQNLGRGPCKGKGDLHGETGQRVSAHFMIERK